MLRAMAFSRVLAAMIDRNETARKAT